MTIDLRMNGIFYASKEIYLDPQVSRRARAIYLAICFLMTLEKLRGEVNIDQLAKAAGYNKRITRATLKELENLGFVMINRRQKLVGLIK